MFKPVNPLLKVNTGIKNRFTSPTLLLPCSKPFTFNLYQNYREVNNYTGIGFRLMYSPLSKILSIHYFSLNPFGISNNKKLQNDVSAFVENQTVYSVNAFN